MRSGGRSGLGSFLRGDAHDSWEMTVPLVTCHFGKGGPDLTVHSLAQLFSASS